MKSLFYLLFIVFITLFLFPLKVKAITEQRIEIKPTFFEKNQFQQKKVFKKIKKRTKKRSRFWKQNRGKENRGLLILCIGAFALIVTMGLLLGVAPIAFIYPLFWLAIGLCGHAAFHDILPKAEKAMLIISIIFNLGFVVIFGGFWLLVARHFD